MSKWNDSFQLKKSKFKVTRCRKLQEIAAYLACVLLMGSRSSAGGSGADCKLGLTIVRPNLLSLPEMLAGLAKIMFF